jgi:hypothetical protein
MVSQIAELGDSGSAFEVFRLSEGYVIFKRMGSGSGSENSGTCQSMVPSTSGTHFREATSSST